MTEAEAVLPRRERERLMRRDAMLEAARAVFAEKGYANATLEEIAQRAEFGKGTLYNYFEGGKEAILKSILDAIYDGLFAITEGCFSTSDGAQDSFRTRLKRYISELLNFFDENRDLFAIMIKEAHRRMFDGESSEQGYFQLQDERMAALLVPPIEGAIASGELKPLRSNAIAHMILGNVYGYLTYALCKCDPAQQKGLTPSEAADFLTVVLYDGLGMKAGK